MSQRNQRQWKNGWWNIIVELDLFSLAFLPHDISLSLDICNLFYISFDDLHDLQCSRHGAIKVEGATKRQFFPEAAVFI